MSGSKKKADARSTIILSNDPKGEIARMRSRAAARSSRVVICDPFGLFDDEGTGHGVTRSICPSYRKRRMIDES